MTATLVGTPGAVVASTASVVNPTTLTPTTGSGYTIGDTLLCFTACRSATPTVATPSGWTSILNVTGTNGRLALFAKVAASTSEAAPSVVWSGMTTGTSGTPAQAVVVAFNDLTNAVLASMADVTGTIANGAASTATSAGGTGITTIANNDLVLSLSTRLDDAGTWTAPAGFTNVTTAMGTTSGSDFAMAWAYQVKTTAGVVTAPNFGLTGASSFASSGVMIALKGGAPFVPADETSIDNFNRADANVAVGGPWISTRPTTPTASDLRVISNQLGSISGGAQGAYTTTAVKGDNCDIVCDVPVLPASGIPAAFYFLLTSPGTSTYSAYTLVVSDTQIGLSRILSGANTDLDIQNPTIGANDTWWFSKRGSAIKVYQKPSGGSYALISSVTDATPHSPASGVIGVLLNDSTARLDNLRGGPQVSAGTVYTDSGSGTVAASGAATESYSHNASATATATATGTGTESYSAPVTNTDSGTGASVASGTGTEAATRSASGTATTTASGTGLETASATDTGTGATTASGTAVESAAHTASSSGTVAASGAGLESAAASDSGAGVVTASGTGVESHAQVYTDTATGTVTATGSGVESYTPGGAGYTDTGSGTVTATGTGVESSSHASAATGTATVTGAGTDTAQHSSTATGTVNATGTGVETYMPPVVYTDAALGTIAVAGLGVDASSHDQSAAGLVTLAGFGVEGYAPPVVYWDIGAGVATVTGVGLEDYVVEGDRAPVPVVRVLAALPLRVRVETPLGPVVGVSGAMLVVRVVPAGRMTVRVMPGRPLRVTAELIRGSVLV